MYTYDLELWPHDLETWSVLLDACKCCVMSFGSNQFNGLPSSEFTRFSWSSLRDLHLQPHAWPWKSFQQFALTWWIFVASFIQIPPLNKEIYVVTQNIGVNGRMHNGRTVRRQTRKHLASRLESSMVKIKIEICYFMFQLFVNELWSSA